MRDEVTLKNLKINEKKILLYGFIKNGDNYKLETKIMNNQFLLVINIVNNIILSDVYEIDTGDKFSLYYIKNALGEYVNKIRNEYNKVVETIKKCSIRDVFKSKYTNMVIKYVKSKYNDDVEFLWDKLPECAVVRNNINRKWYCTLSIVSKKKIGLNDNEKVEIICLRLESDKILNLVDNEKYFKGYHMNKKNWFTIKLDGSVEIEEIYRYIDNSYGISTKK